MQFAVASSSHNNNTQFRDGGQRGANGGAQARVGLTETGESLTIKVGPQVNAQSHLLKLPHLQCHNLRLEWFSDVDNPDVRRPFIGVE